jgi:hypothetical protein
MNHNGYGLFSDFVELLQKKKKKKYVFSPFRYKPALLLPTYPNVALFDELILKISESSVPFAFDSELSSGSEFSDLDSELTLVSEFSVSSVFDSIR